MTVCCETLMFTLTDIFEGQSCLFGWTSSGVWLPGLTSAFYQIEEFVSKALSTILQASSCRSDRVKSCDLHPTEQWMLVSLYNGNVHIWNYESQQLVKSFEVGDLFSLAICRCAIFIFSFAGLRSSSQSGGFCTKEELGRHWFWWYAGWYYYYFHILTNPDFLDPYFQLQHAGETACLWSALRLCQKHCCPPNSGLPWLFTVLTVYC